MPHKTNFTQWHYITNSRASTNPLLRHWVVGFFQPQRMLIWFLPQFQGISKRRRRPFHTMEMPWNVERQKSMSFFFYSYKKLVDRRRLSYKLCQGRSGTSSLPLMDWPFRPATGRTMGGRWMWAEWKQLPPNPWCWRSSERIRRRIARPSTSQIGEGNASSRTQLESREHPETGLNIYWVEWTRSVYCHGTGLSTSFLLFETIGSFLVLDLSYGRFLNHLWLKCLLNRQKLVGLLRPFVSLTPDRTVNKNTLSILPTRYLRWMSCQ